MDLHGLTQGRRMLMVRGAIAFCFGVFASNQMDISAASLVPLFGVWALADGAATVRQAYAPTHGSAQGEVRIILLVLGGVSLLVGLLAVLGLGLSTGVAIGILAAWFAVRVGFDVLAAYGASTRRTRILFSLAAILDATLLGLFATSTSGGVLDIAMLGGGVAAVWGLVYVVVGLTTDRVAVVSAPGPRMLASH